MNSASQVSLNYNPFSPTALTGVVGALYEPLFFMNNLKDDPTQLDPLMGESYTISDDAKTIDVKIREGEKWSDGEPYTAEDVAYTFNLVDSNASLNTSGFAGTAEALSDTEVRITLDKPESVNALSYLSSTMIVPKHVWENVDDPVTYTNEDAVGSGPFTVEGGNFSPTAYTFMKNPYYWEDGKPEVDGVRYALITGGTQAMQNALTGGDDRYYNNVFTQPDGGGDCPGEVALGAYAGYPTSMEEYVASIHKAVAEGLQGGGDPSPVQLLYVGGNAYCGVPVAEQERDVVHIDAPLTIAVEESDDGPVVSVEVPAALASERVLIVGTADLGTPRIVEALYENPNGTPILFDKDIAGERRNRTVAPGPFAQLHPGTNRFVIGRRAR